MIEPELAESWTISDDGLVMTFKIKSDATFWDGRKVTAADVKWSFDRAVSAGGFPTVQMKAGGLERPEQFEAVDDETFVIKLDKPSKLTLPDLAVPVPFIINAEVAKANATGDVGSISCGDALRLTLKVNPETEIIEDAGQTWRCL